MKRRSTGIRDDKNRLIREGDSVLDYTYDSNPWTPYGVGWERYTVRYGTFRRPYRQTDDYSFYKDFGSFQLPFERSLEPRLIDR